jgi:Fur family transcriptional regulator, iron response regulator
LCGRWQDYIRSAMFKPNVQGYAAGQLKSVGLRPTRQRLALARLLFDHGDFHFTAEDLFRRAQEAKIRVSLATIYNTLHQFTDAGLLREVMVHAGKSYFDTNTSNHHHFYWEDTGELQDIPSGEVEVTRLPAPPSGADVRRVDVIVRLRRDA